MYIYIYTDLHIHIIHQHTPNKSGQSSLGANAILAVSMAVCRAGAASMEMSKPWIFLGNMFENLI